MGKKRAIIITLLAIILLLPSFAIAQNCCLNTGSANFCDDSSAADCCGDDEECLETRFLEGQACADSGFCFPEPTCCVDSCTSGLESPLLCPDESFVTKSCSGYSRCEEGCAYYSDSTSSDGIADTPRFLPLYQAVNESESAGEQLLVFNTSITSAECNNETFPPPAQLPDLYSVSGTITDSSTDTPIPNVQVMIGGSAYSTDSNGDYSSSGLIQGSYTLRGWHESYYEGLTTVDVNSDVTGANLQLDPLPTANLQAQVLDVDGNALSGATVTADTTSQTTNENGIADMGNLPTLHPSSIQRYYLVNAVLGDASNSTFFPLTQDVLVTITLPILRTGSINGTVTNATGSPVPDTIISVAGKTATTGPDGFYEIEDIPIGDLDVTISPPSPYLATEATVNVIENETTTYDFTVQIATEEKFNLTVNVTDQDGAPLQNAVVFIRQFGIATGEEYTTGSDGTVTVEKNKDVTYIIRVSKQGYSSEERTKSFSLDTTETFVLEKIEGVSIYGKVEDSEGIPIEDVFMYIQGLESTHFSRTGSNGNYVISDVPILVTHTLSATKTGYKKETRLIPALTNDFEQNITMFTEECFTDIAPPVILTLGMDGNKTVLEFENRCPSVGYYVYRCEGEDCENTKPITNLRDPDTNVFVDENVRPEAFYTYEIHSYFNNPFVQEKASEPASVYTGAEQCFNLQTDEFCHNNVRSECDETNSIVEIEPANLNEYCKQHGTSTRYVSRINCSVECNTPLGMFSIMGTLRLLLEGGQAERVMCADIPIISDLQRYAYCYKDYANTVVSRYYECSNINSCYGYLSQETCQANTCGFGGEEECAWRPYSGDLSLGVCMPKNPAYWDCSRCNQPDKFNNLFGTCDEEICDLYGGNPDDDEVPDHYCYFSNRECAAKEFRSCASYGKNSEQCAPTQNVSVAVSQSGNNEILQESDDLLEFGLCRFGTSPELSYNYRDRCFKDADNNYRPDRNQSDMSPPFTSVIHSTAANSINFPVTVWDDQDRSFISPNAETFFQIAEVIEGRPMAYTRPNLSAQNGFISWAGLPASDKNYTVFFYSRDDADNLEVVKSFNIYIDFVPPPVTFSYYYEKANALLRTTINSTEYLNCTANIYDDSGSIVAGEAGVQGRIGKSFSDSFDVLSGVYTYQYNCTDWVGNKISEEQLIVVDTEDMIYDGQPNTTVKKEDVSEISIRTRADAACRYMDVPLDANGKFAFTTLQGISFDEMVTFEQTNGKLHSSPVSIVEDAIAKMYLVRCRLVETGNLTSSEVAGIRFTVDNLAPEIKIFEAGERIVEKEYNLSRWKNQASILLKCVDPPTPAIDPVPNYPIGEFGCEVLNYCTALQSQCTPQPVIAESSEGEVNGTEVQLSINQTQTLCFNGMDRGGNAGDTECEQIKVDVSSPRITITGLSGKCTNPGGVPACRVPGETISVEGIVQNPAYWADRGGFLPVYFRDFLLDAEVNAQDFAEIIFDYSSENFYDFVQIDFDDDLIRYGQAGQVLGTESFTAGPPVNVTINAQGASAEIIINGLTYGTFERIAQEGYMNLTRNDSFSNLVIIDNSSTSALSGEVSFAINGVEQAQKTQIQSDGSFRADVNVSALLFLNNQGLLSVRARDAAGNMGEDNVFVIIDQVGPLKPPAFDPPITNEQNSLGENYDILGYPLHYDEKEDRYYVGAREGRAYLTGHTSEPGVKLQLFADDSLVAEYQQLSLEQYAEITNLEAGARARKGESQVLIPGDEVTRINTLGETYVRFGGHHRKEYGHYKEAYNVNDVQFVEGQGTVITLDIPLEEEVGQGEQMIFSNMHIKPDRFNMSIPINPNARYEMHTAQLIQYDELGNLGVPTNKLDVIVDAVPPNITGLEPEVSQGRLKKIDRITMTVLEKGSGLRKDNINLTINGARVKNDKINITTKSFEFDENAGVTASYSISYNFEADQDGNYLIKMKAGDKANNFVNHAWNLTVDSKLPRIPTFTILNDVFIANDTKYHFVNGIPIVGASYVEEEEFTTSIVEIGRAELDVPVGNGTVECARTGSFDNFRCTMQIPSFEDGDYHLKIMPIKVFADETFVSKGSPDIFYFVRDTEAPIVQNFTIANEYMRRDAGINFSAMVLNEKHNVIADISITDQDGQTFNLEGETLKITQQDIRGRVPPRNMQKAFLDGMDLEDGQSYAIRLNLSDYGMNYDDSQTARITIDETAPALNPVNIEINARPIYRYSLPSVSGNESLIYIVQKDIVNISGIVPTDVAELSFYRVTGDASRELIGRVFPCKSSLEVACINNETGAFVMPAINTTVVGREGEVITNKIKIIARDRAGNTGETSKLIYSDIEKPSIVICISPTECSEIIREGPDPPQTIEEVVDICAADQQTFLDCYNSHISSMCTEEDTQLIDYECYVSLLAAAGGITKDVRLAELCDDAYVPGFKKKCIMDFVAASGATDLCDVFKGSPSDYEKCISGAG